MASLCSLKIQVTKICLTVRNSSVILKNVDENIIASEAKMVYNIAASPGIMLPIVELGANVEILSMLSTVSEVQAVSPAEAEQADYFVKINGSSMRPLIAEGSLIGVKSHQSPQPGNVVLFAIGKTLSVAQYRGTEVDSATKKTIVLLYFPATPDEPFSFFVDNPNFEICAVANFARVPLR